MKEEKIISLLESVFSMIIRIFAKWFAATP